MYQTTNKIIPLSQLEAVGQLSRSSGCRVVATSGCFDLLHPGHVQFLQKARTLFGNYLIVFLNSDASVRRLKGNGRPFFSQDERALMVAALESVSKVVIFDSDTPESVLAVLQPNSYVKGPNYRIEDMPETGIVQQYGGEVFTLPYLSEHCTTRILNRLQTAPEGRKGKKRR